MDTLDKGKAMRCFGDMVVRIENDPDPGTQEKLTVEFNCRNCAYYSYCRKLTNTLS